jgi:hypothetical protein
MVLYIHPLYILIIKIFSSISNSSALIHTLSHPLYQGGTHTSDFPPFFTSLPPDAISLPSVGGLAPPGPSEPPPPAPASRGGGGRREQRGRQTPRGHGHGGAGEQGGLGRGGTGEHGAGAGSSASPRLSL